MHFVVLPKAYSNSFSVKIIRELLKHLIENLYVIFVKMCSFIRRNHKLLAILSPKVRLYYIHKIAKENSQAFFRFTQK